MPCMKRVHRDKKRVGPLVSSQERRALLVPVTNRLSTGDFVPAFSLNRIPLVRSSGESFRRRVFDALEGTSEACSLDEYFCLHTVLPDFASPPCRAPRPDPPVVCPGFGLDKFLFHLSSASFSLSSCLLGAHFVPAFLLFDFPCDIPGHFMLLAATCPPNSNILPILFPCQAASEAFSRETAHLFTFDLITVLTCRIQNPDTLRAGRIGAAHGGAARWGGAG